MMSDQKLENFFRAYAAETDRIPSRRTVDNILAVPDMAVNGPLFSEGFLPWKINPWNWFEHMIPMAVGWALTCFLGIYIGLSSMEVVMSPVDEEFYMYDQAQLLLSDNFDGEYMDDEGIE